MIFVAAGNMKEYVNWCHHAGLEPQGYSVRYVKDVESLLPYRLTLTDKIEVIGTFWLRIDAAEIMGVIDHLIRIRDLAFGKQE